MNIIPSTRSPSRCYGVATLRTRGRTETLEFKGYSYWKKVVKCREDRQAWKCSTAGCNYIVHTKTKTDLSVVHMGKGKHKCTAEQMSQVESSKELGFAREFKSQRTGSTRLHFKDRVFWHYNVLVSGESSWRCDKHYTGCNAAIVTVSKVDHRVVREIRDHSCQKEVTVSSVIAKKTLWEMKTSKKDSKHANKSIRTSFTQNLSEDVILKLPPVESINRMLRRVNASKSMD